MERYDVAIIGGGSAGLAALKQLSNLNKQAILIEAGKKAGSKNLSGGILYSKKPKHGRTYNVEDVYPEFLQDTPVERRITQYMLHATSRDKVFTMNLTAAHEYQANFGYSVLLNKLNGWFAKQASESAERQGGGIVSGVHVRSLSWQEEKTVIETDELEPFEAKAVIAADGVNSEVAEMTGARAKFTPEQNIKLLAQLAKEIEAEVGISLPISKKPFPVSEGINSTYMIPDRVIGTSGRKVAPLVYIAVGISGAMQHIAGMKESGFIVAINPDENSPIKDECDIFIKGRMEDVIPLLLEELRKQRPTIEVKK